MSEYQHLLPLNKVVDLFHAFNAATTQLQVLQLLDQIKALLDVEGVALMKLEIDQGKQSISDVLTSDFASSGVNGEWTQIYQHDSLDRNDPMLQHALQTQKAFSWQAVKPLLGDPSAAQNEFLAKARAFGLFDGASVAHHVDKGHKKDINIISVSGRDLNAQHLSVLELMAAIVDRSLLQLPETEQPLSPRERDILAWAAEGKSNWDISIICGISERTVKFHFSNIYLKLAAQNRSQAVVKGIKLGYI